MTIFIFSISIFKFSISIFSSSSKKEEEENKDTNPSFDKDWMVFVSERKQRNLSEQALWKKVMINNTLELWKSK